MNLRRAATVMPLIAASFALGAGVALTLMAPSQGDAVAVLPATIEADLLAEGRFRPVDSIRRASGTAQLLAAAPGGLLRLKDFRVTEAPDLEVWLSTDRGIATARDVRAASVLSLGPLRAAAGAQVYPLPEGTEPGRYRSVLIWCAEFGTLYGVADLAR